MKSITLFLLFCQSFLFSGDPFLDLGNEIVGYIKQGNSASIAKHFNDKVDLKILDQEDVYSKAQAESVLKNFFSKYPVKSFTQSHSSSSKSANQFIVGTLDTTKGKFRLSFLIKKFDKNYLISQFRIEAEND